MNRRMRALKRLRAEYTQKMASIVGKVRSAPAWLRGARVVSGSVMKHDALDLFGEAGGGWTVETFALQMETGH